MPRIYRDRQGKVAGESHGFLLELASWTPTGFTIWAFLWLIMMIVLAPFLITGFIWRSNLNPLVKAGLIAMVWGAVIALFVT